MKAKCLVLDKRIELFEDLKKQCEEVGIEVEPFIAGSPTEDECILPLESYDHIDEKDIDLSCWGYGKPEHKINHYNAFKCHHKMITKAKEEGLSHFLMLEDDAYITSRFTEVLYSLQNVEEMQDLNADLLYLGWWIGDENDEFNKKIEEDYSSDGSIGVEKVRQVGGLHGVVINENMYDAILSMRPVNPIDCQLNMMHNKINSYYIKPKIIHIRTTYSYCEGSVIKRNKI